MNPYSHSVFRLGLAVYILFLACGVYFQSNSPEISLIKKEKIYILSCDSDDDSTKSESAKKSGFNSRLAIDEDDDDSARDLCNPMFFGNDGFIKPYMYSTFSYLRYNKDITTPPPKA